MKKNVKKEFVESLKTQNIGDIICNEISYKYDKKKYNKKINISIYNEVKNDKILRKIFS